MSTHTANMDSILDKYKGAGRDSLIPLLQAVQEEYGHLSRETVTRIGQHLNLPASKIYGVATFFNQFRFTAPGKFHVQVCRGTACHVIGSAEVLEAIARELSIKPGETSRDGQFSLEIVACIGACGLAPVIAVNGEFHAKVEPKQVKKIFKTYRKMAAEAEGK